MAPKGWYCFLNILNTVALPVDQVLTPYIHIFKTSKNDRNNIFDTFDSITLECIIFFIPQTISKRFKNEYN